LCSQVLISRLVLILLVVLGTEANVVAQNTINPLPLRTVLTGIEERLQVSFTYADETVDGMLLKPPADSLSIDQVLIYLEANTSLNFYQLDDRFITISPVSSAVINICGYLVDNEDDSKIVGATIRVEDRLVISDTDGYFALHEVPANSVVHIRSLSYIPKSLIANMVKEDSSCTTLRVVPYVTRLEEVMVRNYITTGIDKQLNGSFVVNVDNLGILPGLIEPDVLQTIQTLPGIQSINETVSDINVRGGTNDQNLVLWDGIKMYQTGHFFGLISAFNPYINQEVTLIKNGTGAAFDEGVSSIIDIRSSDKNFKKFSGGAGINMINADLFLKIPVTKKLSLELSGRRAITDLVKSPTFNNYFERVFVNTDVTKSFASGSDTTFNSNENFYFYDLGLNLLYDISSKDKLQFNFLNLYNQLNYQENIISDTITDSKTSSLKQQSIATGIYYQRLWNNRFSTSARLYLSNYALDAVNFDVLNNQRVIQENEVLDTGIKLDALWLINASWDLFSGYQFQEVGIGNLEDINNPEFRRYIKKVIRTHVGFSEVNYHSPSNKTHLRLGVRANYYPKFSRLIVEPRISFNQKFFNYFALEVLGEFKSQTATQVIDLQNDFLGVEKRRWVLANEEDIPIVQSKQVSTGIHFNRNGLLISLEGFYKHVSGITSSSQGFQNQFQYIRTVGNYDVTGIEVLVNKQFDHISTWASYSYNDNVYNFANFTPATFPNNLDLTHIFTYGISVELNKFELSTGVNWRTGKPYTLPQGVENNLITYQSPNSVRLPDYMRIDFSLRYHFNLTRGVRAEVGGSVWNLTNNQNIINIYYLLDEQGEIREIQEFALGITPNLMFRVSF
jgi:TonB-dependent Receptor Plug Domain